MEKSKVYFTNMRARPGMNIQDKLDRLMEAAGIGTIDMANRFVAIKVHFGEPGNLAFLRPNFSKTVADVCKRHGGMPFLTDCNTLYVGRRRHALEHLDAAYENGFSPLSTGCQLIIADGLKGTDDEKRKKRPRHHGRGRDHLLKPLQGPRTFRFRRRHQESRHGLRFPRRKDGAAQ